MLGAEAAQAGQAGQPLVQTIPHARRAPSVGMLGPEAAQAGQPLVQTIPHARRAPLVGVLGSEAALAGPPLVPTLQPAAEYESNSDDDDSEYESDSDEDDSEYKSYSDEDDPEYIQEDTDEPTSGPGVIEVICPAGGSIWESFVEGARTSARTPSEWETAIADLNTIIQPLDTAAVREAEATRLSDVRSAVTDFMGEHLRPSHTLHNPSENYISSLVGHIPLLRSITHIVRAFILMTFPVDHEHRDLRGPNAHIAYPNIDPEGRPTCFTFSVFNPYYVHFRDYLQHILITDFMPITGESNPALNICAYPPLERDFSRICTTPENVSFMAALRKIRSTTTSFLNAVDAILTLCLSGRIFHNLPELFDLPSEDVRFFRIRFDFGGESRTIGVRWFPHQGDCPTRFFIGGYHVSSVVRRAEYAFTVVLSIFVFVAVLHRAGRPDQPGGK